MIKVLTWFRRRPDLARDAFLSHWREHHPEVVLALPGLRRYIQNPTTESGYRKGEPFCDGVAETWWDDLDALRAQRGTEAMAAVAADEDRFIDPASRGHLVTREAVILDGTPGPTPSKQFSWIRPRPDLTIEEAQRYWRDEHGPLAARIPGVVRYVQCHALPELYGRGRDPSHMGIPIVWLTDLEAARAAAASPELAATRADEVNFLASEHLPFVVSDEIEIPLG